MKAVHLGGFKCKDCAEIFASQSARSVHIRIHHSTTLTALKVRQIKYEPRSEKTCLGISDQDPHKPGCTATEDCKRLEISDLGRRGIVLSK